VISSALSITAKDYRNCSSVMQSGGLVKRLFHIPGWHAAGAAEPFPRCASYWFDAVSRRLPRLCGRLSDECDPRQRRQYRPRPLYLLSRMRERLSGCPPTRSRSSMVCCAC